MAAYAAVTSLMHILDQLQNHPSPPISLDKQQVGSLNEIATSLQKFLETYESSFGYSDEADPVEIRIMNAAYAAEDAIESHIVKAIKTTTAYHQKTYSGEETRSSSSEEVNLEDRRVNLYEDLHQLIERMNSINLKEDLHQAITIDVEKEKEVVPDFASRSSSTEQSQSTSMLCSRDVLLEVLKKLMSEDHRRQVIPITGMGGIGKTTLARAVYSEPSVKKHFDICAWVTISSKFNTREILCELLCKTTNKMKEELSEDDAGSELHRCLCYRRFLIVMDDMWSIDVWEQMQRFFPDNRNGSRVLVTTRLSHLASQLTNDYSLEMKFLDGFQSWELFSKTVFGKEICPLELEEIAKKIVRDCKGLPLSIVVVGGVLKKVERTREHWESIRKDLTSVVNMENNEHSLKLLKLSYNQLPAYLKPCFLYMGVFEEDKAIRVSKLVKLWVSEGFVRPMNGKSLETVAQGFLKDLIDRNLILIDGLKWSGDVKYCKIHDLLRDLCLKESGKYGFYDVMGQGSIPRGINSQRRLVISEGTSIIDELQSMPVARSIIGEYEYILSWQNYGLLRILHDNSQYKCNVDTLAFECVNLRHLACRVYHMSSFLCSMIFLWNLHTLIVHCHYECRAPKKIWKMAQFRHIEFIKEPLYLPDPAGRVVVMENLQILKGVKNFRCGEKVVKRCPNLRKLRIIYFDCNVSDRYSLNNIERLCQLESLSISCEDQFYRIASLHELTFPHSLKSLSLNLEKLPELEDLLGNIGSIPYLEKLKLVGGCFRTRKWEIGEDQFPCLKYLSLSDCSGLKHWTAAEEESSIFPCLEQLYLHEIKKLERIPCEIGYIPTLLKIELDRCNESAVMSTKDIVDEQVHEQAEDLSFRVVVRLWSYQEELKWRLEGPHFEVKY